MDQGNFRSLRTRLVSIRPLHALLAFGRGVSRVASLTLSPSSLNRMVGRALGLSHARVEFAGHGGTIPSAGLDSLEQRTLFEGSFATAIVVGLNASGQGNSAGAINPAVNTTNNDYYAFVAPADDFVTILADSSNEISTVLDTRVTVYAANQTTIVAQGFNNGTLSRGLAKDGWTGFVAQAGATYYVVVSSEGTAQGTYNLRIDARTTAFDIGGEQPTEVGVGREFGSPVPSAPFIPITPILGEIGRRQEDIVYRYVVPSTQPYDSIVTINAQSTQLQNLAQRLDTRLEVYTAAGVLVPNAGDSDSGRINDAFLTIKASPDEVYFIRVRSDEIANANVNLATGPFFLVLDGMATDLTLNPVTRIFSGAGAFLGFGNPSVNPSDPVPRPTFQTDSYEFTSLGGGTTIITVQPTGLAPVNDPAIRLLDENGALIAFNDNFIGTSSQLEVQLIGGTRYFLVIDGFEVSSAVQYTLDIESNHTFDPTAATPNDDHANNSIFAGEPLTNAVVEQFNRATSLSWSAPRLSFDGNRNPLRDRGYVADATATGRIYRSGDTDLFKFVPQVDMLHDHPGDNDDAGTSLFIGGSFTTADPNTAHPVGSRSFTSWDASDYWFTGPQFFDPVFNVTYGFNDNLNPTSTFAGPVVYTTFEFDPDPTFTPANGTTDRVLMIGGDFTLILPTPNGPVFFHNVIGWAQNQQTGVWGFANLVGSTNGAVRAFATFDPESFDPDGSGPAPTIPDPSGEVLAMGGDFTNVLGGSNAGIYVPNFAARFLVTFNFELGSASAIGNTLNAGVRALTTWDIPDPGAGREFAVGPPLLAAVADPYDAPLSLIIGGAFTGGVTTYDGGRLVPLNFGSPSRPLQPSAVVGTVNALQVIDDPDPDGPTEGSVGLKEAAQVLVIAGRFSTAGTLVGNAGNIVKYGRVNPILAESDPALAPYDPKLIWETLFNGSTGTTGGANGLQTSPGTIHDLQLWDPADINNNTIDPVLVIGGNFTSISGLAAGNIAAYGFIGDVAETAAGLVNIFGIGTNAVVRALSTVVGGDEQEPSVAQNLRTGNLQDPLYLGGDFTTVQFAPTAPPIVARGVAQFSAFRGLFADFFNYSRLNNGLADDIDATGAAPGDISVFSLNNFDDGDPFSWDHHDRRATRLSITVSPASGAFLNTFVRVYDSNFNIVYGFDRPGSNTISPPFPDPAGMIDFSFGVAQDFTLEGIQVWGGETYYIEISAGPGGNGQPAFGEGRYNLRVTADALPPDLPIAPATVGNGVPDDINADFNSEPIEGSFVRAIRINNALATGDGTNFVLSSTQPLHGNSTKSMHVTPSLNARYNFAFDLGNISTLTDTDLYSFRAEFTGTAEIRLGTTGIPDEYGQQIGNVFTPLTKNYTSRFDGALRIFDNDFQQLGYNNDQAAISGPFQTFSSGSTSATFQRRDSRIVISVESGKQYFIQVESGQRYSLPTPADPALRVANVSREIDFGTATGSYVLIVNAMPQLQQDIDFDNQSVVDDHADAVASFPATAVLATVINVADNGLGGISGVINDTPIKPNDTDVFRFIVPGGGALSIVLSDAPSALNAQLRVFFIDPNLGPVFVADGQPGAGGRLTVTTAAQTSEEYMIVVDGLDNGQGAYALSVTTAPFLDDHADFGKLWNATDIKLFDFLGSGEATGNIEISGDTDIFRFEAITYQRLRATVTALDSSLAPRLEIYEVSEDPSGRPVLLRIGANANTAGAETAGVFFPVAPERIIDVAPQGPGPEDREYPYYYVLVRGVDSFASTGRYRLDLSFEPTDDHADGSTVPPFVTFDTGEFNLATSITLDSTTGRGNAIGVIEQIGDSDLFRFTAPASGEATVIISRPTGSLLRPKVSIVDGNANIILDVLGLPAQSIGEDNEIFFQATLAFNAVRGTTYFIIVEGFDDPDFPNVITEDSGAYTVSVNAPPLDDYPNITEWAISDLQATITLGSVTGLGQIGGDFGGDPANALISPSNDTDLFNFTTRIAGNQTITLTPFNTTNGRFAPKLTVFIANGSGGGTQVAQVLATSALQEVTVLITGAAANVKYYILVEARVPLAGASPTGEYRLRVQGPTGSGGGGGSDSTTIDFSNPTVVPLLARNGDGCFDDQINVAGDRDLFRFRSTAAGRIYVQLTTPEGSLLDASVSVYNQANELITSRVAFDADGYAGVASNLSFVGTANTNYYVVVDGLGDSVGTYQLCINTQPVVNYLYFPEGFATDQTREFISIDNPNGVTVNYTIYLRYEMGQAQTVIANGTVGANSRGGVTIIDGTSFVSAGVLKGTPYSVVIESDQPLGATLAHYDFGSSIGDSFTERVSTQWNFARVERDNGSVLDFITFYNPSNFDVDVTITAYQTDQPAASLTKTFGALRRGGFAINDIDNLPRGVFSVVLTAKATVVANQAAFEGVVASLSHYEIGAEAAWGLIGEPGIGSRAGAITSFFKGTFSKSEAIFFNNNDLPVTVTLTGSYLRSALPDFSRTFDIKARGQVILTDSDFGLIDGQPVGFKYVASLPITVNGANYQQGDADSSTAATGVGTRFLFGDAFIDPKLAGDKFFEYLYFYNPTAAANAVTIKLNFTDGTSSSFNVNVSARGFAEVRLHERNELLSRAGPTWFAVEASSISPFALSMTHYDLLLGGGWATMGVPLGFVNEVARIS